MNAASGSVNVAHDVGVHADAFDVFHAFANALMNLQANNGLTIGGNVDATATADQNGAGQSWARACANMVLEAVHGDINLAKNLHASANALSKGSDFAIADGFINATAALGDVLVHGAVTANAHAETSSQHGLNGALALSSITLHGDPVIVDSIVEHATATSHGGGLANAQANANVTADSITVNHNVDILARASQDGVAGDSALASANLQLHANRIHVNGPADVNASAIAHGSEFGNAQANALASINAGNGNASFNAINVTAHASQAGSDGSTANALAELQLHGGNIHIASDLVVEADAPHQGHANVLANLLAVGDIDVGGNVTLNAAGSVVASVLLMMNAASSISIGKDVTLNAQVASANLLAGSNIKVGESVNLSALGGSANLAMNAADGSINIASNLMLAANGGKASADLLAGTKIVLGGNADVTAHGGNAILSMNAASGSIDIGSDVSLFANGDGTVRARFSADAGGNVFAHDIDVSASANGELNQAASAAANIHAGSDIALNEVNVSADITVIQGARFTGSHAVTANIQLNAGGSIHVNGDVIASATAGASAASGMVNAAAIANLVAGGNIDVAGNIGLNAIASATSGGGGVAKALLTLEAGGLASIGGDISVTANAHAAFERPRQRLGQYRCRLAPADRRRYRQGDCHWRPRRPSLCQSGDECIDRCGHGEWRYRRLCGGGRRQRRGQCVNCDHRGGRHHPEWRRSHCLGPDRPRQWHDHGLPPGEPYHP